MLPVFLDVSGMPYNPEAVANWFLKRQEPDHMKLQKLVYFAHGWTLGLTDEPLLNVQVEAWDYGPVVNRLYHELKDFGSRPITRRARRWKIIDGKPVRIIPVLPESDRMTMAILERVWELYGDKSGVYLSALTHLSDSPWTQTRQENPHIIGPDIPNEKIHKYFKRLARRAA